MGPHPLHFISCTTWDFSFLSKGEFKVGRHNPNFRGMNTTFKSHIFFNLLAQFCIRLPLYSRINLVYLEIQSCSLMIFWCCFQLFFFCQLLSFSKVWLTIFENL